jgi:RNA-binding protein
MAELTSRQRAHLKSLAHSLKPIIQIGKEGVTDALARSVEDAFHTRELFKIKVLDSAPIDAREIADMIAGAIENAHVVQVIGRTIVLYRPDPEEPEIRLP